MAGDITEQLRQTYNYIAPAWHKNRVNDTWWIPVTEKYISLLKPGAIVLDVGCGSGITAEYLMDRGVSVIGFDISEEMTALARKNVPNGKFFVLDMHETDSISEKFGGVLMRASLLHIQRDQAAAIVQKMATLLELGGFLYIAVKEVKENGLLEEFKMEEDFGMTFTRFFSYFTLLEIKEFMTVAGLDIVHESVTPSGRSRWIEVIGQKPL